MRSVSRVIEKLHDSEFSVSTRQDQGNVVTRSRSRDKRSERHNRRFHCNSREGPPTSTRRSQSTRAAVLYVFSVMVDDEIPMKRGVGMAPDQHHHPKTRCCGPRNTPRRSSRRQCRRCRRWSPTPCSARLRRDGRRARGRWNEQSQIRQQHIPVLRGRSAAGSPRPTVSPGTEPGGCNPHDQHPGSPRSGRSSNKLSGGC